MREARSRWGGARAGAGRPARGPIASEPHKTRPALSPRHPVHVRSRVTQTIQRLPTRLVYRALRRAIDRSLARDTFRIVHMKLMSSRLELVVEADDKTALARGMQGFQVSAARSLNRVARRRGNVFPDRYRMEMLITRSAVRAIAHSLTRAIAIAWPQTWLARVELGGMSKRRWIHSRADEDS